MCDLDFGINPFLDNDQWLLIIEITQVSVIWYVHSWAMAIKPLRQLVSTLLKVKSSILKWKYSQTSIVRGGRGYQISKKFPRITEVRVVKRLIKCWHQFTVKVVDYVLQSELRT